MRSLLFPWTTTRDLVAPAKPDPDLFLAAATRLGTPTRWSSAAACLMSGPPTVDRVQRLTRERPTDNSLSILSERLNTLGVEFSPRRQTAQEIVRGALRSSILR